MTKFREVLKSAKTQVSLKAILLTLIIGSIFSALIPPFQSPDEFDHIKRAYLLTKGQILLKTPQGQASGGEIDSGLLSYFSGFQSLPFHPDKKMSKEEEFNVSSIRWSRKRVFSPAPGTGYYFPLAYAPQAFGLAIGENLGLSVKSSYQLARSFTLTFSVVLLAAAFAIFPANAFILGLLIVPMNIFQFCSASLDAFTTAVTVLCIGLFTRGCNKKFSFPCWMSYLLASCILILTTSRIHLLPLLILPLLIWFVRKDKTILWQSLILTISSLAWLLVAIKTTHDNRIVSDHSTAEAIAFYIQHPAVLIGILQNTLIDPIHTEFYRNSFIGILGWLDTRFDDYFYALIFNNLILLAVFSISLKSLKNDWQSRVTIVILSLLSSFLIFFALLVTWNSMPTKMIEGVQGRYFIGPLVMLGYALGGSAGFFEGKWRKIAIIPLLSLGFVVIFHFPKILVERYYEATNETADVRFKMQPSTQLNTRLPIKIFMTSIHQDERMDLKRIGVMFGTYARQNPGDAELRLKSPDSNEFVQRFSLSNLVDNKYRYFELDSKRYTSGEILSITGSGVSTWESHNEKGDANTCIIYEYSNGKRRSTPGCPLF